ncbi:MAG: hypothetical protein MJ109_01470 [Kiritimatiellae bacterium]|nr:hypothetical protein [Kiritimatiellia bacterium]
MEDNGFISFLCDKCKTEIEATLDLIGQDTECPACGAHIIVPDNRDDGIKRHSADEDDDRSHLLKGRTIRIELDL